MRPRWWFAAWAAGLRGTTILLWLGGSLLAAGLTYWMQLENLVDLFEFGDLGREIFWESFPYWWAGGIAIMMISGGVLYSKLGDNYKRGTKIAAMVTTLVMLVSTLLLLWIGYKNELEILLQLI